MPLHSFAAKVKEAIDVAEKALKSTVKLILADENPQKIELVTLINRLNDTISFVEGVSKLNSVSLLEGVLDSIGFPGSANVDSTQPVLNDARNPGPSSGSARNYSAEFGIRRLLGYLTKDGKTVFHLVCNRLLALQIDLEKVKDNRRNNRTLKKTVSQVEIGALNQGIQERADAERLVEGKLSKTCEVLQKLLVYFQAYLSVVGEELIRDFICSQDKNGCFFWQNLLLLYSHGYESVSFAMVKQLAGYHADWRDGCGRNVIMYLVSYCQYRDQELCWKDLVKPMLEKRPELISTQDEWGNTILHYTVCRGVKADALLNHMLVEPANTGTTISIPVLHIKQALR